MVLSEVIDSIFREMPFDAVLSIAKANVRYIFLNIYTHLFFEVLRDLAKVTATIKEGSYRRFQALFIEVVKG